LYKQTKPEFSIPPYPTPPGLHGSTGLFRAPLSPAGHFSRRCLRCDRKQISLSTPIQHITGNLARGNATSLFPVTQPIGGDNLEEGKGKGKVTNLLDGSRGYWEGTGLPAGNHVYTRIQFINIGVLGKKIFTATTFEFSK
jgi:hypothetical protein